MEAFNSMSQENATNYKALKALLQVRYQLTEEGFRNQFYDSKPRQGEPAEEFMTRLTRYLSKWMVLGDVKETFDELKDLIVREQFLRSLNKDMYLYLREKKLGTSKQVIEYADRYMQVHHCSLNSKRPIAPTGNTSVHKHVPPPVRQGEYQNPIEV